MSDPRGAYAPGPAVKVQQLEPADLSRWLADPASAQPLLLDVREPWEIEIASIPGSVAFPIGEIPARVDELAQCARPIVCVCHHGVRSAQVAYFLASRGLGPIYNLVGGIDAWSRDVDPHCPHY